MTNPNSSFSYDQVPYPSTPKSQTHPNRLAVLAKLFGMNPAPVHACRVLELGCADGSNLIPMAYQWPESEFVGLDLAIEPIVTGQAKIAALGLQNISLRQQNIMEVTADWGQFDYIIVYGIYSWVPEEVQDKILEICQQNLAPQGVAYVSYNIYPGWHMVGMVREMMRYHTRNLTEPYARAKQARVVLDFLAKTVPALTTNPSNSLKANSLILETVQKLLHEQPDEYLLHDQLAEINAPLYLYQFIERAGQHGLQYLTDAESSAMLAAYFPAQFARELQELAKTNLEIEQFMDFLYCRTFRQTLLCHQELSLNRGDVNPEMWSALHLASPAKPLSAKPNIYSTDEEKFRGPIGTTITLDQPFNKAALLYLTELWPQIVPFNKLVTAARSRLNPTAPPVYNAANLANDAKALSATLLRGYALTLVELYASPPPFVAEISEKPVASTLARLQVKDTNYVTNQRHETITLDEISYYLLPYLDGRHHRTALLEALLELVKAGVLVVPPDNGTPQTMAQVRDTLSQAIDWSLHKLSQDALLVG